MKPSIVVNVPKKGWIGTMYTFITAFVTLIAAVVLYNLASLMTYWGVLVLLITFSFIIAMFGFITFCYHGTKYVIRDMTLYSWSPFMVIRLPLKDVRKVELTRVPVHVRVGASLYCGFFYIPNVGWTRSIITNLTDGLLIYARNGRKYLITPSQPGKFARLLKR